MNHTDKISVLHDMLVLSGRMGLLRPDESRFWVVCIYARQRSAASSLLKWADRPVVAAALLERSLHMPEGENVVEHIRRLLYTAIGFDACILDCSRLFYPFNQVDGLTWLLGLCEETFNESNVLPQPHHDCVAAVAHLCFRCLITWEQCGICVLDDWVKEEAKLIFQRLTPPSAAVEKQAMATFGMARHLAGCLWGPVISGSGMSSWRELVAMGAEPRICALALLMAYGGPKYMVSSLDEARAGGVALPDTTSLPLSLPSNGVKCTYPISVERDIEAGEALNRVVPGAKEWIDLDVTHMTFEPDDPSRLAFVERLVGDNEDMNRVYRALDLNA